MEGMGMNTRKARVKVPRKKRICCTRSPASTGEGRRHQPTLHSQALKAWESGRPGFRSLLCCCLVGPP